jgi:hypothetical protein
MKVGHIACIVACLVLLVSSCNQQEQQANAQRPQQGRGGRMDERRSKQPGQRQPRGPEQDAESRTEVPAHDYDLILAQPTDNSVTLSVLAYRDMEGLAVFGAQQGFYPNSSDKVTISRGEPVNIFIGSGANPLKPNTRYYYKFRWHEPPSGEYTSSPEYAFVTQRAPGSEFTFTITADSHLDGNTDTNLYATTLADALADKPDFHVDLGDTFMTEKHKDRDSALQQYLAQRCYFGTLAHSAPLFIALGNHDGETARERDGGNDSTAVWAATTRRKYFPSPSGGKMRTDTFGGENANELSDYYSWTWGDALFVVLDPYWFTPKMQQGNDNWNWTLGEFQYVWLKGTLAESKAKYKFIFIHNLVGGLDKDARGGAEAAKLYEWGGNNSDGSYGFKDIRPGWPAPIHKLLVDNRVTAVFHGHDHFFAHQELDGIAYQLVPQPGSWNTDKDSAAEYGYQTGDFLPSSGYMRVHVAPDGVKIEYVRSATPEMEQRGMRNGEVAFKYTLP